MLAAEALPVAASDPDAFDIRRLAPLATVLRPSDGREFLLFSDGCHHLQLDIVDGSLLAGPVRLRYALSGLRHIEAKTLTLRRLALLYRLGRFPRGLFPSEPRVHRWVLTLRAYEGRMAGASDRDIAEVLFGRNVVRDDWCGGTGYLRLRVQRLLRRADGLVNGGYRDLLPGGPVKKERTTGLSVTG